MRKGFAAAVSVLLLASIASARQPVHARHTMVVARETHATDVGDAILAAGGNAVDAAVAVALMLAVTHPSAGNLGGGGFMLIRLASGKSTFLDFRERAPAAATRDMYLDANGDVTEDSTLGYRASGIPGTVRGLDYAQKKYGKRKWSEVVTPAMDLAATGFPVSWGLAHSLTSKAISAKLSKFPDSKRIFLNEGNFFEPGDTLVQPDLAWTLDRIRSKGADDFYTGETAHRLATDMQLHGGLVTLDDLRDYKVIEREPLTGSYHGYDIVTSPPPSSGGAGIIQMLAMLDGTDYAKTGAGSARSLHFLAEVMRRYFADRSEYMGDPDFFTVPLTKLLDPGYIARRRATIDPLHATPSDKILPGKLDGKESTETTHFSIVDAEGNAVSMTYTLNGSFGSGVTAEGLGFLLNNEMDDFAAKPGTKNMFGLIQGEADAIAPQKTPLSAMTPTIVTRDGELFMVLGAPGGPTIINTVMQTILNVVDFNMNAQEAVDQPRIHHQWMPDEIRYERGISPDTLDMLRSMGHTVSEARGFIGEIAAIVSEDGWLQGAADGRVEATAKGH
jgi:gamma-glutamyltranspeptidase/glutathione hydrolase